MAIQVDQKQMHEKLSTVTMWDLPTDKRRIKSIYIQCKMSRGILRPVCGKYGPNPDYTVGNDDQATNRVYYLN